MHYVFFRLFHFLFRPFEQWGETLYSAVFAYSFSLSVTKVNHWRDLSDISY